MKGPSFLNVDPKILKSDERIIVAAMKVFSEKSLDQASLREIAKEADISFSAITYYFKTKENLYREVIVRTLNFVLGSVSSEWSASPDTLETGEAKQELKAIISGMTEWIYGFSQSNIFARIILREHVSPSPIYGMLHRDFFSKIIDHIAMLLRALRKDWPPRRASIQAFNVLGQIAAFRLERELLVRHLGFEGFSAGEVEELKNILIENIFRQLEVEPC